MSWIQVDGYSPNTMRSGCLICGNNDVRHTANGPEPILSSGFDDEWAGTPAICATCIGEAASMLGWVSGPAHAKEVAARLEAQTEVADLTTQLDERAATIRTLTSELARALDAAPFVEPELTVPRPKTSRTFTASAT